MKQYRKCVTRQPPRKRVLILCEGGKTEPNYFKGLRVDPSHAKSLSGVQVVVHPTKKNSAKELVAEAISLMKEAKQERNAYDEVWVVVDRDGYTKHPESFDRAIANKIRIGFSSTCFEYWILLHFEYTTRQFANCDEVIEVLNRHIPEYDKADNIYDKIKDRTQTAIANGERVIRYWAQEAGDGRPIWNFLPYTDVGKLVDSLINDNEEPEVTARRAEE